MHAPTLPRRTLKLTLLVLSLGASGVTLAKGTCDLVSRTEASHLLGTVAGVRTPLERKAGQSGCLIAAAHGSDSLRLSLVTLPEGSPRLRQHMDEERGGVDNDEDSWYEISAPDDAHPGDRRLVIHRDRTILTLDLRSSHQTDAKMSFESLWHDIAERLPFDKREVESTAKR
jgi:hypothetical protein